jgi:hypothetical protein
MTLVRSRARCAKVYLPFTLAFTWMTSSTSPCPKKRKTCLRSNWAPNAEPVLWVKCPGSSIVNTKEKLSQTGPRLTVSITQTAKIEELIDTHGMLECNPVSSSPYCSGFAIDQIPPDNIPVEDKVTLVKKYQSLVGGLLWVQMHTRPEISTAVSPLCSHRIRATQRLPTTKPGNVFSCGYKELLTKVFDSPKGVVDAPGKCIISY